jgi:YesN/AraC family two-component response regulator
VAYNGKEALKLVEEHKPDVIISDVVMPEMNGLELCRALKSNFETAKIPFVVLTARVSPEQKIEGMESGADDYITKPFNFDLLNLRISNLIKWRKTSEQTRLDPQVKQIEITSLDEKLVQDATTYVEDNINNPELSVESLSEAMNMSRVHLYKKLLMLTGSTPSEFIRLIRLRRAEQLLCQSQLSVAEISYMVGFNNPRYFSKYFKEMYGMMPSQYKEVKKGYFNNLYTNS